MSTMKVNLVFQTIGEFRECRNALYVMRVKIVNTHVDYYRGIFTYYLEATREQVHKLLDLAYEHNGLLTKGEA